MRIAASEVSFAAAHTATSSVQSNLQIAVARPSVVAADTVSLSDAGTAASKAAADESLPPNLAVLKLLIERLFGTKINLGHLVQPASQDAAPPPPATTPAPAAAGSGAAGFSYTEHREESEHLNVQADGVVQTSDGQRIAFKLELTLDRKFTQDLELDVSTGKLTPRKKDPLVINFNGTAAELGNGRFNFDLNQDGKTESVTTLGAGSGFLVLDRNGDGKINNGGELFGASSGNGFAELGAFDQDHNGWIDENDAVYKRLGVWQPGSDGSGAVRSLSSTNVGAIYLGNVASPYEYRSSANTPVASLRSTGVYLKDSGGAGTVQQLDLYS